MQPVPLRLSLFSESHLSPALLTCLVIVEKLWHENWLPVSFHIGIRCIFFSIGPLLLKDFPPLGYWALGNFNHLWSRWGQSTSWAEPASSTSCIYSPSHSRLLISGQKCDRAKSDVHRRKANAHWYLSLMWHQPSGLCWEKGKNRSEVYFAQNN